MTTDKLKLNDGKTEFIIIGTRAQLDKINITKLSIDQVKVSAVSSVRNLGTWFDNHLTMTTAINMTCQSGLYHFHNIRRIKRFLEDRKSIVQAITMSRIDYCNSLLYGVTATNLTKLQLVQNAAARLVCPIPRNEHVTPSLINLHWLPIRFRINCKIAMFDFKCIHGQAPNYLKNLIEIKKSTRHNLRSNSVLQLQNNSTKTKKTLGDRAFTHTAVKVWNSLPQELELRNNAVLLNLSLKRTILNKLSIYSFTFYLMPFFIFYCKL